MTKEQAEGARQKQGGRALVKQIVTEAKKGVAESLQELLVLIAAEVAKREIWG